VSSSSPGLPPGQPEALVALLNTWRSAAEDLARARTALQLAAARLPQGVLPLMQAAANTSLLSQVQAARQALDSLSLGGLFSPDPSSLGPLLTRLQQVLDDYQAAEVSGEVGMIHGAAGGEVVSSGVQPGLCIAVAHLQVEQMLCSGSPYLNRACCIPHLLHRSTLPLTW
jgi:hypothetical protein